MFQEELLANMRHTRARWLSWLVAGASWIASMIFMLLAKDQSFPNMPGQIMFVIWLVAQGAELFLVMGFIVLVKYGWSLLFSDELRERQTPFMSGRLFLICLLSIALGLVPAVFDLWSTSTILMGWASETLGVAVWFSRWLALFVVLGSELALSLSDDVQHVYLRMAQVESEMVFIDHDDRSEPLYVPDGMSRAEAYRRLTGEDNEEESR